LKDYLGSTDTHQKVMAVADRFSCLIFFMSTHFIAYVHNPINNFSCIALVITIEYFRYIYLIF